MVSMNLHSQDLNNVLYKMKILNFLQTLEIRHGTEQPFLYYAAHKLPKNWIQKGKNTKQGKPPSLSEL